jgi:hypothetical protein
VPVRPLRVGFPMFFIPSPPRSPFLFPWGERKGAMGEVRVVGVLRSTGAEVVVTLFQRVAETHTLPATVP